MFVLCGYKVVEYNLNSYSEKFIFYILLDEQSALSSSEISTRIEGIQGLAGVRMISSDDALGFFSKTYKIDSKELFLSNDFPDLLIASVKPDFQVPEKFYNLPGKIRMIDGVKDIVFRDDVIKSVLDNRATAMKISILGSIFFLIIIILFILSIVTSMIKNYSKEIKLFNFIGTRTYFSLSPFLFKLIFTDLAGGLLAVMLFYFLWTWLSREFFWLNLNLINIIITGVVLMLLLNQILLHFTFLFVNKRFTNRDLLAG